MTEQGTSQLIVHGGAGSWSDSDQESALEGLRVALEAGGAMLQIHGSALEAVVEAVAIMEDNPLFNAGRGSCLTWDGEAEMDACVMVGKDRSAGAVAHVKGVKNPVLVARDVMEHTDHVILGGGGARRFARARGYGPYDPVTGEARERLKEMKQSVQEDGGSTGWPRLAELIRAHPEWLTGTVGAVARDASGNLAAATSTGGRMGKLPGRIGDTPVPGAGNLATDEAAASATGNGERILRHRLTSRFAQHVERGTTAPRAAQSVLEELEDGVRKQVGVIGIDPSGSTGIAHGSENMPHGWLDEEGEPVVRMNDVA